jgi:hypothetical protein
VQAFKKQLPIANFPKITMAMIRDKFSAEQQSKNVIRL